MRWGTPPLSFCHVLAHSGGGRGRYPPSFPQQPAPSPAPLREFSSYSGLLHEPSAPSRTFPGYCFPLDKGREGLELTFGHRVGRGGTNWESSTDIYTLCVCVCVCVWELSHAQLFVTPRTVACQALLPMRFSRQEYWGRLPFPSPGSSRPRDRTWVSCISCTGRQVRYH